MGPEFVIPPERLRRVRLVMVAAAAVLFGLGGYVVVTTAFWYPNRWATNAVLAGVTVALGVWALVSPAVWPRLIRAGRPPQRRQ